MPHDWELNIISAIQNGCYYLDIPLIDYRIHNNNTIGMDNIVDGNIINEKKQRVNERIEQTKAQIENVNFALGLELNREQKKYCLKYKDYLTQRVLMMKEKKACSLILYFLKGKYKIKSDIEIKNVKQVVELLCEIGILQNGEDGVRKNYRSFPCASCVFDLSEEQINNIRAKILCRIRRKTNKRR